MTTAGQDMQHDSATAARLASGSGSREFLTMTIDGQLLGIPVLQVQDVLGPQRVTRVPLAPPEIEGSLNLRGRIVTAINLRRRLGISAARTAQEGTMSIVVEHRGDLYSLIVDSVGDVLSLPRDKAEAPPPTLEPAWRSHALEIYRMQDKLLVILDISTMLDNMRGDDDEQPQEGAA